MGFLDRVISGLQPEFRAASGLARPQAWLVDALSAGRTISGQKVTPVKALGLAPVWSAVSIISETIGMLPLKVYRELPGRDGEVVVATDHRAYRMLHTQPNPVTPAHRYWSTVAAHLLLWGNAYLQKSRSEVSGLVEELWLLDPSVMTVEWDGRAKTFVEDSAQGRRRWSEDDVLHITGLSLDGLMGESVISRCRDALGTVMSRQEFEGTFYARGATPRVALRHPERLGPDASKNVRESWNMIYGGSANAHQAAILEEGLDVLKLSMPLSDMEFVASQQLSRTDIAIMFKLPPAYLGGSTGDSLTYATVESNQIQFAQNAISPWANTIAKAVGSDFGIFPFQSWYPEFVMEGLMRGDHKSRADFYTAMFNLKDDEGKRGMTVDEIRAKENLPPAEKPPEPPQPEPPPANGNGAVPDIAQLVGDSVAD